jgi:hypothetical protein
MTKIILICAAVFTSLVYVVNSATDEAFRVPGKEINRTEISRFKKLEVPLKTIARPLKRNLIGFVESYHHSCIDQKPFELEVLIEDKAETVQSEEITRCYMYVSNCKMMEPLIEKADSVIAASVSKIDEREIKELSIKLFPNPMHEQARIEIDEVDNLSYSIELYDLSGKLVRHEMNLSGSVYVLQRNELPSGIYIWKFIGNNNQVKSGKLIAA